MSALASSVIKTLLRPHSCMATWQAGSDHKVKLGARYTQAGISAPTSPLIKNDLFSALLTQGNMVRRRTATAQYLSLSNFTKAVLKRIWVCMWKVRSEENCHLYGLRQSRNFDSSMWIRLLSTQISIQHKTVRCFFFFICRIFFPCVHNPNWLVKYSISSNVLLM